MVGLGIQQTVGTLLSYTIDLALAGEAYSYFKIFQ